MAFQVLLYDAADGVIDETDTSDSVINFFLKSLHYYNIFIVNLSNLPDKRKLAIMLRQRGIYPADCVYIGCESESLQAAKELGIAIIGIETPYSPRSSAEYVLTSLEGIDYQWIRRIYERHAGIPWTITETKRTLIRESTLSDVDDFYRIYKPESVSRFLSPLHEKKEDELEYMKNYIERIYRFYEVGIWTVCEKQTGEVIGRAGANIRPFEGETIVELGYMIAEPWQGKGIATEVLEAVLLYLEEEPILEDFRYLDCLVDIDNTASRHLAQKIGFREEKECQVDGKAMIRYRKALHY